MRCQYCGSETHEATQPTAECEAELAAARSRILAAQQEPPGQMRLGEDPPHEHKWERHPDPSGNNDVHWTCPCGAVTDKRPDLEPKADVIQVKRFEYRDLAIGQPFLKAKDLGRNPTDPPIYIKLRPLGPRPVCMNLRTGDHPAIEHTESVCRILINAITFEYRDVLEIEGVGRVIAPAAKKVPK